MELVVDRHVRVADFTIYWETSPGIEFLETTGVSSDEYGFVK